MSQRTGNDSPQCQRKRLTQQNVPRRQALSKPPTVMLYSKLSELLASCPISLQAPESEKPGQFPKNKILQINNLFL